MKTVNRTFWEMVKRFFEPAIARKDLSIKAIFQVILLSIISISTIFIIKEITNNLVEGFDDISKELLLAFIILVIIYYIIMLVSRHWTHSSMWPGFRAYLYKLYIKKFSFLDNNETEKLGTGKLIAMLDKGMYSHVDLLVKFFVDLLPSFMLVIFSFIFIGIINITYLIIVLFIFILISILTYILQRKAKIYRLKRRENNIGITRRFVKVLMSKFEILQNNKAEEEGNHIVKLLNKQLLYNYKVQNYNIGTDIILKVLIDSSKVFVIILFGVGFLNTTINFGEFIALMSIIYMLDSIFTSSFNLYIDWTKVFVDVEKLWDLFDTTPQITGYEEGNTFKHKNGEIKLKKVTSSYTEGKDIFKNFDLDIQGEKVTAIVGSSGAGKTTLIKLISGYIKPNSGEIIIDNQKLSETSLKSYYKDIGYLTQEPSVFDGTVLDNLTYGVETPPSVPPLSGEGSNSNILPPVRGKYPKGDGGINNEHLNKIINLAKCEFIYDLPNGINTEIGEKGVRLSGGQRQRLAIAKIFLKDPKIILLDEPTSALDSFSEELITKAMHNLFKGRTIIIIAHRLQTVKNADDIILLEDGKITERGTHAELVKQKGIYKKMLDLQSGF